MVFKLTRLGFFIAAAYFVGALLILDEGGAWMGSCLVAAALISDSLLYRPGDSMRVVAFVILGYFVSVLLLLMHAESQLRAMPAPLLLGACLIADVVIRRAGQLKDVAPHDHAEQVLTPTD